MTVIIERLCVYCGSDTDMISGRSLTPDIAIDACIWRVAVPLISLIALITLIGLVALISLVALIFLVGCASWLIALRTLTRRGRLLNSRRAGRVRSYLLLCWTYCLQEPWREEGNETKCNRQREQECSDE